ncbi:MAG: ParB/RepB/Spo0J family partition protein [Chloroflexota bacterium]
MSQPIQPRTGDLSQLFSTATDTEQAAGMQLLAIRTETIVPDPEQPRRTFPEEGLRELAESIRQDGVIQPIEVTQTGPQQYMIVHGERRWRAAQLAELETVPAVVRRRDYDEVTRFVRQLVENIQREDLNDVDRAAGLLRLRELMQEELTVRLAAESEDIPADPWGKTISWAKVGERLGYSRQRINQLTNLLDLPEEIQESVRSGELSERETRILRGLKPSQQRALHRALQAGDITADEFQQVARFLKKHAPDMMVQEAIRHLRQPEPEPAEPLFKTSLKQPAEPAAEPVDPTWQEARVLADRSGRPIGIARLDWIRGHLARVPRQGLTAADRQEMVRLLNLIQEDVASLLTVLRETKNVKRET